MASWKRQWDNRVHYFTDSNRDLGKESFWIFGKRENTQRVVNLEYADGYWYLTPAGFVDKDMNKLEKKWFKKKSEAIAYFKKWSKKHEMKSNKKLKEVV